MPYVIRDCVYQLRAEQFSGTLLVATNPVDVMSFVAQRESGLPAKQVIGSGTVIDSARLRALLAAELKIEPRSVHGYIIGEHGNSEIAVWSGMRVAGIALADFHKRTSFRPLSSYQHTRFPIYELSRVAGS
jgi:L-lactate dehydrogenase